MPKRKCSHLRSNRKASMSNLLVRVGPGNLLSSFSFIALLLCNRCRVSFRSGSGKFSNWLFDLGETQIAGNLTPSLTRKGNREKGATLRKKFRLDSWSGVKWDHTYLPRTVLPSWHLNFPHFRYSMDALNLTSPRDAAISSRQASQGLRGEG